MSSFLRPIKAEILSEAILRRPGGQSDSQRRQENEHRTPSTGTAGSIVNSPAWP